MSFLYNFISILSLLLLLNGCEKRVYDLGVYRYSELQDSSFIPIESDILNSGRYRVKVDLDIPKKVRDEIIALLKSVEESVYIENSVLDSNLTHTIRGDFSKVGNYLNGRVEIINSRFNLVEKRIPVVIDNNSSIGENFKREVKKLFTIKRGFILSKRVGDDNIAIFEISLGRNSSIGKGDAVSIYRVEQGVDFLTRDVKYRLVKIASGTVSDKIYRDRAWIFLKRDSYVNKIELGNLIIIGYNRFSDYLEDGGHLLKNHPELLDNSIFR